MYIIGVDVGGTYIRTGLVNSKGEVLDFNISLTADFLKNGDFLKDFIIYLKNYKNKANKISIGFPSTIDKSRKVLLSTPNIQGLDNLPIVDILEKELDCNIYIDKDVNHLLVYDMSRLNISNDKTIIGIYIGTGLGNAIFLHGKLLHGANGSAGELGHIHFRGESTTCTCGNIGCCENYASGRALVHKTKDIQDIFINHDTTDFINDLAIAISTEVNILDPDLVIIGGGVAQMKGFPIGKLTQRIIFYARKPYPANNLKFYHSIGDKTDGVVGAGLNVFKNGGIT